MHLQRQQDNTRAATHCCSVEHASLGYHHQAYTTMASLDEFNPGRWEEEDEDFLDREDNYVLQKSTNTLVTNVTARTRRSSHERASGRNRPPPTNSKMSARQPPSFSASGKSLRKTKSGSRKSFDHNGGGGNQKPSLHAAKHHHHHHHDEAIQSSSMSSSQPAPKPPPVKNAPVVSNRKTATPVAPKHESLSNEKRLPGLLGLASEEDNKSSSTDSDEESLDIVQVFPVLKEPAKPPSPHDAHYKSQQIFIPTKQEKWNEVTVMRMHQSMYEVTRHESPYMKDVEFDDDDKSLNIEDVFPVLAGSSVKRTPVNPTGPIIVQAAKKANANIRWTTAGQKIAATRHAPAAKQEPAPLLVPPPLPAPVKPPPPIAAKPPPTLKEAPMYDGHNSQETSTSTEGKKGYQLPTHVRRPSPNAEDLHASDDLTMDSALMKSNSNQNLKEQEESIAQQERQVQQHLEEEEMRTSEAARLERKKSKRAKKDSKKKKKRSKSSRRHLTPEDREASSMTEHRHRDTSLGPESVMDNEEEERERRRLKKERKERRKLKKERKKQKRATQSERHLPTQLHNDRAQEEQESRMSRSMPDMEEGQSTSPDNTPPKRVSESRSVKPASERKMSVSQSATATKPVLDNYLDKREDTSERRKSSRRSLHSGSSSKKSDSRRSTKSNGHIVRAKSLRPSKDDSDDDDSDDGGGLDSYIREDKKMASESVSASKLSVRSDSHSTVKKSNVAHKKDEPPVTTRPLPPASPHSPVSKIDTNDFMRSAAAGMLYESEDSWSPAEAAAVRSRVQAARAESRRAISPPLDRNAALKPVMPSKEPLDKNVSSTWQSSSSLPFPRDPLKSSASMRRPQKQGMSPSFRGTTSHQASAAARPDLSENESMSSVGNIDMMAAVDAAVAAKRAEKQGTGNLLAVAD